MIKFKKFNLFLSGTSLTHEFFGIFTPNKKKQDLYLKLSKVLIAVNPEASLHTAAASLHQAASLHTAATG